MHTSYERPQTDLQRFLLFWTEVQENLIPPAKRFNAWLRRSAFARKSFSLLKIVKKHPDGTRDTQFWRLSKCEGICHEKCVHNERACSVFVVFNLFKNEPYRRAYSFFRKNTRSTHWERQRPCQLFVSKVIWLPSLTYFGSIRIRPIRSNFPFKRTKVS